MDLSMTGSLYQSIAVRFEAEVCTISMNQGASGNTITRVLIDEIGHALQECETSARIVVLEGTPDVFCSGADFQGIARNRALGGALADHVPDAMYEVWRRLACGPFISVAHVRGKATAGGIGFVAACDIVLAEEKAMFSLSEMLFGLTPACVMPFLMRRIGLARANYLTLGTQAIGARVAEQWGLVDAVEEHSENLLRKQLLRLKRLSKAAIVRHKQYTNGLDDSFARAKPAALRTNVEAFSDPQNLAHIDRYVATGRFPWEAGA